MLPIVNVVGETRGGDALKVADIEVIEDEIELALQLAQIGFDIDGAQLAVLLLQILLDPQLEHAAKMQVVEAAQQQYRQKE